MTTFFKLLKEATTKLSKHNIEMPELDAAFLLEHCFNITKTQVLTQFKEPIRNQSKCKEYQIYVNKRCNGTPLAYITGSTQFMNSEYYVNKGVLIPRPETERLIEHSTQHIHTKFGNKPDITILELGLGTGVISIELAKRFPNITIHAWDISKRAINNASRNIERHKIKNINVYHKNFFSDLIRISYLLKERPVIIITNPPYIDTKELQTLEVKQHEPKQALDGGKNGLKVYKRLLKELQDNSFTLCCEIGYNQKEQLINTLEKHKWTNSEFFDDYQGHPRVCIASKTSRNN